MAGIGLLCTQLYFLDHMQFYVSKSEYLWILFSGFVKVCFDILGHTQCFGSVAFVVGMTWRSSEVDQLAGCNFVSSIKISSYVQFFSLKTLVEAECARNMLYLCFILYITFGLAAKISYFRLICSFQCSNLVP